MRYIILAIAACGLASACTVKSERTVVEKPVVATPAASAVVYTDPVPATTTTVQVR